MQTSRLNTMTFYLAVLMVLLCSVGNVWADQSSSSSKPVEEQLVDEFTVLAHGPYPGYRANHAKGIMVNGSFSPTKSAKSLSKAAHLRGSASKVLVRFSDGTGVPTIPDAAPGNVHGMAIRFFLPDGTFSDIVAISVNTFPVSTPEDFLAFLKAAGASGPDAPKPTPMDLFLKTHPAALKFVTSIKYPSSFATQAFYGLNAFRFTNSKGEARFGRYRIVPLAGEQDLTDAEIAKASPDYLMDDLQARLKKGQVKYHVSVQLAEKGDPVNDMTAVWPESRPVIDLGTLTLKSVVENSREEEKTVMFSPTNLTDGIDSSDDPILAARPIAYAISFGRRSGQ